MLIINLCMTCCNVELQHAIQTAEACRKAYPDDDVKRNRFLSSVATNHVVKAVSKRIAVRIKIDENPNLNEIERSKYIQRVPEDIKIESLSSSCLVNF